MDQCPGERLRTLSSDTGLSVLTFDQCPGLLVQFWTLLASQIAGARSACQQGPAEFDAIASSSPCNDACLEKQSCFALKLPGSLLLEDDEA